MRKKPFTKFTFIFFLQLCILLRKGNCFSATGRARRGDSSLKLQAHSTFLKPSISIQSNSPTKRVRISKRFPLGTSYPKSVTSLLLSNSDGSSSSIAVDDGSNDDDSLKESESDEKTHLSKSYQAGTYLFGLVGLLLSIIPDRTGTALLASKLGGAAGFGIAAGLCHILKGANDNDRLKSDTYKRLNLGLFAFSAIGVFALPGEAGFQSSVVFTFILSCWTVILRIFGMGLGYLGLKRGAGAANGKFIEEIVSISKDTLKGIRVKDKRKSMTYRNCFVLVLLGAISNVMDGIFMLRYMDTFPKSNFRISLQTSAVARLLMISTMIYSLKDAAERDRLTGTTFIQLNFMVGFWALTVAIGQGIVSTGFEPYRGVEMIALALPFLIKGAKSQKEKDEKMEAKL